MSAFIVALATGAIVWNLARQEVYYLCGNFISGVERASVVRQLDTANLSSYKQSTTKSGSKIVFSSKYNFDTYQCIIEFDKDNKVVSATYGSS
ncbi:MAG: hypothetical protein U5O39_05575 [Gammaproteobacteria bacterium]|nr:hypothetical protein [Gammaproteobacteria bacterium]